MSEFCDENRIGVLATVSVYYIIRYSGKGLLQTSGIALFWASPGYVKIFGDGRKPG